MHRSVASFRSVELGTKEQSEQKGSAEEAHKMRMAGEQELF